MGVLIKGGTIVTAERTYRGDIYTEGEVIKAIGENLDVPANTETVDAGGCYVMPGGIDPQTHMQLPFMGTNAIDDFYTGTTAMMTGGTTMLIDFVIPGPEVPLMEAYKTWRGWGEKSSGDYSFHVAVTWWDDSVYNDMRTLATEYGVNSFKHFLAYKGAIMADDEILIKSFENAKELGALVTIHAEKFAQIIHPETWWVAATGADAFPMFSGGIESKYRGAALEQDRGGFFGDVLAVLGSSPVACDQGYVTV